MPRKFKPKPVPAPGANTVATGQPYGQAQQQREALQAVPAVDPARAAAQAQQFQPVGIGGPPSDAERSMFPETAGLPFGAGPGPEAVGLEQLQPPGRGEELEEAANVLPLLEVLSSQPGASSGMRRMVRALRAEIVSARPTMRG